MLEFSVENLKYVSSFSLGEIREPLNLDSSSLEALACCVYNFGVEELRDVVQNEQLHEAAVSAVPASVVKADFTEGDVALSLAKGSTFFLGLPKKILAKKNNN